MVLVARNFWYSVSSAWVAGCSGFTYRGQPFSWASPSAAPQVHWVSSCSGSASGSWVVSSSTVGVVSPLEVAAALSLSPWSSETANAAGSAMLMTSVRLSSSAHTFFIFIAQPPYAFGQPLASMTVLPLLAVCTAWAATSTVTSASRYILSMVPLKATLLKMGSVTSPGFNTLL